MKSLTYIEIDIPFCANTYGVAPCTAALGVTGDIKCFNSKKTCQDRVNYVDAPVTLRFSEDRGYLPDDIEAITSIRSIAFTPATISLGQDLGQRASLSVTFDDHPWPDTAPGFDKYVTERDYNPYTQGTFWGKFRARQPYLRGQTLRLIQGQVGQALEDMSTRHYLIDSFTYDVASGTYTLVAKDVLKFADDDRAQAPVLSSGFLSADITSTDLYATMQPAGIGNAEYPVEGYVAISGKEICSYIRDPNAGNDANTKLLIHFEGADASTTFTDSSSGAKAITANGNIQVDTAQKKFGLSSGLFDGSGDYLSLADHADWTPAGNFTFDFWVRFNALSSTQTLFTHYTGTNDRYFLQTSSTGVLTFSVISASVTIVTMASAAGAVAADGTWRHVAVVRNGNVWTIYVNGVSVATTTDADAIPNFTSQFRIGSDNGGGTSFNGWIDEFRYSTVARWTTAFTPQSTVYQVSGDVLELTRAQLNTAADDHKAQDRVQMLLQYVSEDPADIIRDLLVNYANVPDSYIPIDAWRTETSSFLGRVLSADLAEPTGVNKLISEIILDSALCLWWDDVNQQIRLRVIRAVSTDAALFDESVYMENTFQSRDQPDTRVSQVWRYFAKRNPCEGQEDENNYRSVAIEVDLQAETDYGSPAIKKIFSRWIPFGGRSVADRANELYLARFRDPPRRFNLSLFRNDLIIPEIGQGYLLGGFGIQDETGADDTTPIQITRLYPMDYQYDVEAEEMLVTTAAIDLTNRVIIIDGNALDINLRDLHDTLYPEPTDADVIAGVNLVCVVETGVVVGASDNSAPAFDVGSWPVGFPILITVNGRLFGSGGDGGTYAPSGAPGLQNGEQGGTALYTRFPIDLEVIGEIWGGGGGGGATFYRATGASQSGSQGGKGGDGEVAGSNGANYVWNGGVFIPGGAGGGPGLPGSAGIDNAVRTQPAGSGGAAGNAIDGVSHITITVGPGDRRGPEIN